jgi:haloacetate dehalogenase
VGFEDGRCAVGEASYFVAQGGTGPPLLLLHGFPETHLCWQEVAPELARANSIVAPDLRGYGASRAPAGGPRGEGYSKREMAGELVELMAAFGHDRFEVVGHDRGARVAFRLALDHPERVSRVALLNVVPTADQFERMGARPSLGYWPWFLLAQPAPFPERLVGADPGALLEHVFATWSSNGDAIGPEKRDAYRRAGASPARCSSSPARTRRSSRMRDRSGRPGPRISPQLGCPAGTSFPRRRPGNLRRS